MILPNRGLKLPADTDDLLRKLKLRTKVTPNVISRISFFKSVESGERYTGQTQVIDGSLTLDKITWLGELSDIIEATLKMLYPNLNNEKEYYQAWAYHVVHGTKMLRMVKSIDDLI